MVLLKYCLPLFLCLASTGFAQPLSDSIKPLNVGDDAPQITFSNLYNSSSKTLAFAELKGKLVILDFWGTWCGACIENFPRLQSLQQKFPSALRIIMVNEQPEKNAAAIKLFFDNRKRKFNESNILPSILQDSILTKYFPHTGIPHYVWIDTAGKVAAITSSDAVNEKSIATMLQTGIAPTDFKNDQLIYDPAYPMLSDVNKADDSVILYRSLITRSVKKMGSPSGLIEDTALRVTKHYELNFPLSTLFIMAYPDVFIFPPNRTIYEVGKADMKVEYCYELITPPISRKEISLYMQQDLYRNFRMVARIENRDMPCYIISGKPKVILKKKDNLVLNSAQHIINENVQTVIDFFSSLLGKPVINETGISEKVNIDLPGNVESFSGLQLIDFIKNLGFNIVEVSKKMDVSVVTNKISQ